MHNPSARPLMFPMGLALALVLALPAALLPGQALAQDGEFDVGRNDESRTERREREKRERQQAKEKESGAQAQAQADTAARYPDAMRSEPEARASRKLSPKIDRLSAVYAQKDAAAAAALADEIIADDAANAYDKAISARIAGELLLASEPERGLALLRRAIEFNGLSNSDHYETMRVLAQRELQGPDKPAAMALVQRYIDESKTQNNDDLILHGVALYQVERFDEAIVPLKRAVDQAGENAKPEWKQALMAAYAAAGRSEEATALADQAASQASGDPKAQLNLAGTYIQSQQLDKAAAIYEQLRAAGQLGEERDYRNLLNIYRRGENNDEKIIAVILDGTGKGILKEDHATLVSLAEAYYFSGQEEQAISAYRKAAPLASNGETYLNLAKVLLNARRNEEARQAARQALEKGLASPEEANRVISRAGG